MLIPPKYVLTSKISQLLSSIEAAKAVIDAVTIPPEVEINIRRQSTLKSSLFSARIEGNPLTLDDINKNPSKDQRKQEVFNILKALNLIHQKSFKNLTSSLILALHKIVLSGITTQESSRFRSELGAIFNTAGIAVYLPPPPKKIKGLIERLIRFINSSREPLIPIKTVLVHYIFEKIHPFLDGNGRVGRLLIQAMLVKDGYGMKGLLSLEEYLDNHRSEYYQSLDASERDVTDYLEFMLEAIAATASEAKELVLQKRQSNMEDYLPLRRSEILILIKEHKFMSFNQIQRRFLKVNDRTLRYDLKKLQDAGLIRKRGTTKGVYYEAV